MKNGSNHRVHGERLSIYSLAYTLLEEKKHKNKNISLLVQEISSRLFYLNENDLISIKKVLENQEKYNKNNTLLIKSSDIKNLLDKFKAKFSAINKNNSRKKESEIIKGEILELAIQKQIEIYKLLILNTINDIVK